MAIEDGARSVFRPSRQEEGAWRLRSCGITDGSPTKKAPVSRRFVIAMIA